MDFMLVRRGDGAQVISFGDSLCPCTTDKLRFPNATAEYDVADDYGIGCKPHDETNSANPDWECTENNENAPSYCAFSWCYIHPDDECLLGNDISWSQLYPGIRFSYETCGYFNSFRTYDLERRLRGTTIKVVYLQNSGGWKGSTCNNELCTGPVVTYLSKVLRQYQVKFDVVHYFGSGDDYYVDLLNPPFPEAVMDAIARARPSDVANGKVSGFNACVIATGLGYVDLCIALFGINVGRQQLTNMIHLVSEPLVLVAAAYESDPSFWDKFQAAFKPFTNELWWIVFACILLFSVVMVMQEHGKEDFKDVPIWKMPVIGIFKGLESMFGGSSTFAAHTLGGHISHLGFGFFILLIIASYTANLASLLVVSKAISTDIGGMDDILSRSWKVCTTGSFKTQLENLFPETVAANTFVTVDSRTAAMASIGTSCEAAAVRLQDVQEQQASGGFCNIVQVGPALMYTGDGIPASSRIFRSLQWAFTDSTNGGIGVELEKEQPSSACEDDGAGSDEEQSLTIDNMLGVFVVSLGALGVGILLDFIKKICRHEAVARLSGREQADNSLPAATDVQVVEEMKDVVCVPDPQKWKATSTV